MGQLLNIFLDVVDEEVVRVERRNDVPRVPMKLHSSSASGICGAVPGLKRPPARTLEGAPFHW